MHILFFGSLGDRLGREIDVPEIACATVGELRQLLAARGEAFASALLRPDVTASIDRVVARDDSPIGSAREVAFFPLLSGG